MVAHNMRWMAARYEIDDAGCWRWMGAKDLGGYGKAGTRMAHRVMYELLVGPIPEGLQLDHLCRVRNCVRPDHLEPVTIRENVLRSDNPAGRNARKTHCPQGHEYDEENTAQRAQGRFCRACERVRQPARYEILKVRRAEARYLKAAGLPYKKYLLNDQ